MTFGCYSPFGFRKKKEKRKMIKVAKPIRQGEEKI